MPDISPKEAALLVLFLIKSYDDEKERTTTRARISTKTLRRISFRARLRDSFIDDWTDALAELGWGAFQFDDHFALVQLSSVDGWPRIAATRLKDTLQRLKSYKADVFSEILDTLGESEEIDDLE